jgi:integrase
MHLTVCVDRPYEIVWRYADESQTHCWLGRPNKGLKSITYTAERPPQTQGLPPLPWRRFTNGKGQQIEKQAPWPPHESVVITDVRLYELDAPSLVEHDSHLAVTDSECAMPKELTRSQRRLHKQICTNEKRLRDDISEAQTQAWGRLLVLARKSMNAQTKKKAPTKQQTKHTKAQVTVTTDDLLDAQWNITDAIQQGETTDDPAGGLFEDSDSQSAKPPMDSPSEETFEDFADAVGELAAVNTNALFHSGHAETPRMAGWGNIEALKGEHLIQMLQQPPQTSMPKIALEGLKKSTVKEHGRLLRNLIIWMHEGRYTAENLPAAIVKTIMRRRQQQQWRWSSTLKTLATAQGALKLLPMYRASTPSLALGQSIIWRQTMRAVGRKAREELPQQPLAATWEEVLHAAQSTKCICTYSAILIAWFTAARVGCVLQLQRQDITVHQDRTMSVTFIRGKGAVMRQQAYTVHTPPLPQTVLPRLQKWLGERRTWLFPTGTDWGARVREQLRTVNKQLEQRSLRRGSLQALATAPGMDDATLLLFSGHASVTTLRRYLNWGKVAVHTKHAMVEKAGAALVTRRK